LILFNKIAYFMKGRGQAGQTITGANDRLNDR